jgi:hypothetical protein
MFGCGPRRQNQTVVDNDNERPELQVVGSTLEELAVLLFGSRHPQFRDCNLRVLCSFYSKLDIFLVFFFAACIFFCNVTLNNDS